MDFALFLGLAALTGAVAEHTYDGSCAIVRRYWAEPRSCALVKITITVVFPPPRTHNGSVRLTVSKNNESRSTLGRDKEKRSQIPMVMPALGRIRTWLDGMIDR